MGYSKGEVGDYASESSYAEFSSSSEGIYIEYIAGENGSIEIDLTYKNQNYADKIEMWD
jgi:hypothetical protein